MPNNKYIPKIFEKFYKKEFDLDYISYKILGIKIRKNKNKEIPNLADLRCYQMASTIHKNLEKYRGIYTNKNILIIGGGPSLQYLDVIPKNCIKIGINRAYKLKNIDFDYLFAQDKFPNKDESIEFAEYNQETCTKFFGIHALNNNYRIRQNIISRAKKKEIYILNSRRPIDGLATIDISMEPIMRFNATVFSVLQFVLFTNPSNIYLAGFDCTDYGHAFRNDCENFNLFSQYEYWKQFKKYKELFFEENKIISINPINLKGMFDDIYTESFVNTHKNLKNKNIEILNKGENLK